MEDKDIYYKEDTYQKEIAPLVKDLKLLCYKNRMPMFITVATENNENGTQFESDMVLAAAEIRLTDNRIAQVLLYMQGLDVELPKNVQEALKTIEQYRQALSAEDRTRVAVKLQNNLPETAKDIVIGGGHATFKRNEIEDNFSEGSSDTDSFTVVNHQE